jgi:predicted anti-sigma-YlaC factor YlaD
MRDCPTVEMRERLPDLLHDRLPAAERALIHAHLNECADCRAELALLERVRAATVTPRVDTSRIAAALPSYKATPRWRRLTTSSLLRIAAVLVVIVGGLVLLRQARLRTDEPQAPPMVAVPQTTPSTESATVELRRRVAPAAAQTELAMGELFDDLSDSELQALLDALGSLEAVTPVETEVVIPAVNRDGT